MGRSVRDLTIADAAVIFQSHSSLGFTILFFWMPITNSVGGFSIGPPAEFHDGLPELAMLFLVAQPQARHFRLFSAFRSWGSK